jgi:hypothetical protein
MQRKRNSITKSVSIMPAASADSRDGKPDNVTVPKQDTLLVVRR